MFGLMLGGTLPFILAFNSLMPTDNFIRLGSFISIICAKKGPLEGNRSKTLSPSITRAEIVVTVGSLVCTELVGGTELTGLPISDLVSSKCRLQHEMLDGE